MHLNPDFSSWSEQSGEAVGREVGLEEWREETLGTTLNLLHTGPTVSFVPNSTWAGPVGSNVSVYLPCHLHLLFHRAPHSSGSCMSPFGSFALSKASDDTGWGSLATGNETWHLKFTKSLCNQIFLSEYLSWYCYFLLISHSDLLFPLGNIPQALLCQPGYSCFLCRLYVQGLNPILFDFFLVFIQVLSSVLWKVNSPPCML